MHNVFLLLLLYTNKNLIYFFNNFVLILMFISVIILNLRLDYYLNYGESFEHTKIKFFISFYIGPGKRISKRQHIKKLKRQK